MGKETVREIDAEYYLIKIGSLYVGNNIVQNLESRNFGLNLTKEEKAYKFYKNYITNVADALKELDIKEYKLIYVERVIETSTSVVMIDEEGNVVSVEDPVGETEEPTDGGAGNGDGGQDGSGETPVDTETPDEPVEETPAPEEPVEEITSDNG